MVKSRRSRNKVSRVRGGGGGGGWTAGGPIVPGLASDAQVNKVYDGCLSAERPGSIPFYNTGRGVPMSGGAYTNNLSGGPIAGFAEIQRDASHCTPNHVNTMNNGKIMQGGASAGPAVGVAGIPIAASAAPILQEDTARYTGNPSQWTSSVGAPIWLNQSLDAKMWSKACTQTGGKRSKAKAKAKSRKAKKTRVVKKSRKARAKKTRRKY